jgi:hypothetical protein
VINEPRPAASVILLIRPISDFDTFVFYTTIAEKTLTPVLTTRYVPATIVLTITSAAMGKNSSIEGSDGDSLSENRRQHGFRYS